MRSWRGAGRARDGTRGRWLLLALAGLVLSYILLFTSLEIVAGSSRFYPITLLRPEIGQATGLDQVQRREVLERILGFAVGRRPDLQFTMPGGSVRAGEPAFSADELRHMEDVRGLFGLGRLLRNLGLAVLVGLLFLCRSLGPERGAPFARRPGWRGLLAATCRWAAAWGFGFLLVVGVAAVVSFRDAFDAMHMLLFRNDLWLLPADALLIQMLPEEQFAFLAAWAGGAFLAALVAALTWGLWAGKGRRRRALG